ncbi:thymidylate synthase [Patescibacteria group bacterium]|nr:thymidylate synthase [Patescibacteria group bacterium]
MDIAYKPLAERTPDTQYQDRLKYIFEHGMWVQVTPQGTGALTCFGVLPQMVFDPANGVPLITDRKISFWKKPIGEIIAFMNGAHIIGEIESYGCTGDAFWGPYRGKGTELGLEPDDLGPGSYGPAFHDFPMPGGGTLNQFAQLIDQIKKFPNIRTHFISPWIPFYTARGPNRKVQVAPCHGWVQFRVINGKLYMLMFQRSADFGLGVPSNMIQYMALLLMVCQVTGYAPGHFAHLFGDAHIYEEQIPSMRELVERKPRAFPILRLDPAVKNLFDFRVEHFSLEEYDPHPAMKIPYSP